MTFGKVSEVLIEDLRQKSKNQNNTLTEKDESNTKRRVYDAINVMIASQIMVKKDK